MKYYCYHDSPVGQLFLAGTPDTLHIIEFSKNGMSGVPKDGWQKDERVFSKPISQLNEYFCGERTEFSVELELAGTDFQRKVWEVLATIPFGTTLSYGEVARRIGQPTASRAVGMANNANPIPIIIPCHRVIGANRSMVGFGGGIDTKIKLLELEYKLSGSLRRQGDLFY